MHRKNKNLIKTGSQDQGHIGVKNNLKKSICTQKTCPLCNACDFVDVDTEEIKIQCNTNNVGCRCRCLTCKEKDIVKVYEEETGISARIRGTEHVKDFEKKKEKVFFLNTS